MRNVSDSGNSTLYKSLLRENGAKVKNGGDTRAILSLFLFKSKTQPNTRPPHCAVINIALCTSAVRSDASSRMFHGAVMTSSRVQSEARARSDDCTSVVRPYASNVPRRSYDVIT
ncbi:unnamed protein product, partial [Iphiclides podalirius]